MVLYEDDDGGEWEREEYEKAVIKSFVDDLEIRAALYLRRYGDSVEARTRAALVETGRLLAADFHGPALVDAVIAIELVVRYLLLQPLLEGSFLSDELAEVVTERVLGDAKASRQRQLVKDVLGAWGIDVDGFKVGGDQDLLVATRSVVDLRNLHVHEGAPVSRAMTELAVECAHTFAGDVVKAVLARVGVQRVSPEGTMGKGEGTRSSPFAR